MAVIAICDANVLIDFSKADIDVIPKIVEYYGKACVPDVILAEVGGILEAEAESFGLTVLESPLELEKIPSLSFQDRVCLYYVKKNKWECLTNDRALRKNCIEAGGTVVWGLEMLLKLAESELISSARAEKIARTINRNNTEINNRILKQFLYKLKKLSLAQNTIKENNMRPEQKTEKIQEKNPGGHGEIKTIERSEKDGQIFKKNTVRSWFIKSNSSKLNVMYGKAFNKEGVPNGHNVITSSIKSIIINEQEKEYEIQTQNTLYHCSFDSINFEEQDKSSFALPDYERIKNEYNQPVPCSTPPVTPGKNEHGAIGE